ncbi:Uncharacterised protein [uncultured archaeon]|nr:Uncharacterised protein [uncultured archaeon]
MLKRREFIKRLAALFSVIISGRLDKYPQEDNRNVQRGTPLKTEKSNVYVIKTTDRDWGIRELLKRLGSGDISGKKVAIKANYNSSDPFPASTHIDTLGAIVDFLKENGASIVLAERSGMGNTKKVLEDTGVMELAGQKGFDVVILDDRKTGWSREKPQGSHWKNGFLFPDVFRDADAVVQTCCLKTHRFGGHFTMSLKNSVGMVARYDPEDGYDYMGELHSSRYQRQMIAEINTAYEPVFVIMDAIEGFSKGGPDTGTLIQPGILIAARDRVALDAAGIALLRMYGTTDEVTSGGIFEQEQIAKAAELGLGATSPDEIEIIADNEEAGDICKKSRSSSGKPVYESPIVTFSILSPTAIFSTTSCPSMTCPNMAYCPSRNFASSRQI